MTFKQLVYKKIRNQVLIFFLDFFKAFDTTDHTTIMQKILTVKSGNLTFNYFKSYLLSTALQIQCRITASTHINNLTLFLPQVSL